ncbi:unnamed protein product [Mesocestoides corti]|uniref:Protein CNPPD1 n=2 Tax=Mesocestoides corti TaxID=53468 RepID=A0A0R3UGY4_MESCO|nr:unnamed protein product [Mesocestoides corti]
MQNTLNCLSGTVINLVNSATGRQLGKLDVYTLSEFISKVTPSTLITALIFVEKFHAIEPKPLLFSEITATELLVVATMVASKFLYDTDSEEALCNSDWANEFDIDLKTLNLMEIRFLRSLDWKLFVSKSHIDEFIARHLVNGEKVLGDGTRKVSMLCKHRSRSSSAFRIPGTPFDRNRVKTRARWQVAKAMAVFAAAFLAVSQPPTTVFLGSNPLDQLPSPVSFVTHGFSSSFPNPSNLCFDQLTTPHCVYLNFSAPQPLLSRAIQNGSAFPFYRDCLYPVCSTITQPYSTTYNLSSNTTLSSVVGVG